MQWIRTEEQSLPHLTDSVLTIGNFDGVHKGHQSLLKAVKHVSLTKKVPSVVCTFKPHPLTIIKPELVVHRIFDYKDQFEQIEKIGLDFLIEEKFTKQMSLLTGQEFLDNYIFKHFNPSVLVVGYDFSFGKNKQADHDFLKKYCEQKNKEIQIIDAVELNQQIVSTSLIKKCLENGDVKKAENLLGRTYYLRGPVKVGFRRGRTLGVPTANIHPAVDFIPRRGVYFTTTIVDNIEYRSITNIGINPTFENSENMIKVETHILDYNKDLYGTHVQVNLKEFYRDEKKFKSIDELKLAIMNDIDSARNYFEISKI